MAAKDSKCCDGDVRDSQGMSALQAERDKGRGKRKRVGRRERGVSLLGSSPNNKLLALLCIYAEPTSAVPPGAARTLKGHIVSEQIRENLLVVG